MKKENKDRLQYAKLLKSQGVSVDEILNDSIFSDINPNTRRTWKRRLSETEKAKPETAVETHNAPTETQTPTVSKVETLETPIETQRNDPEKPAQRSVFAVFCSDTAKNFHPADLLFYASVSVGCYGVSSALQSVGVVSVIVSCILFGVAAVALQGLKSAATNWDKILYSSFMLLVEAFLFLSDLHWANKALWSNVAELPLNIWFNRVYDGTGQLVFIPGGSDIEVPFKIACGIAAVLFFSEMFACLIALRGKK